MLLLSFQTYSRFTEQSSVDTLSEIRSCPSGWSQNQTGKQFCLPCLAGKSQPLIGQAECSDCKVGMHSFGTSKVCLSCEKGTYMNKAGASGCIKCDPGMYTLVANSIECKTCPIGRHKSTKGDGDCVDCSVGLVANSRRSECIHPSWKTEYDCAEDEYLDDNNVDKNEWICNTCPNGGSCIGPINASGIRAMFGWSRCPVLSSIVNSTGVIVNFTECVGNGCLGAYNPGIKKSKLNDMKSNLTESCSVGHINPPSINLRCSKCEDGYVQVAATDKCEKCQSSKLSIVFIILAILISIIFFILLIAFKMRGKGSKKAEHSTMKRTLLTHMQMVTIIMSLVVPWPTSVRVVMSAVSSM